MHTAARPFASAGVSLIGATAIAMTPVLAPTISTQIHHAEAQIEQVAVQLAAAANPFSAYGDLFADTIANLQTIISTAQSNGPTPILTSALNNQLTGLQDILTLLSAPGSLSVSAGGQPAVPFAAAPSLIHALGSTLGQVGTNLTGAVPALLKSAVTDLLKGNVEDATNQLLLVGLNALIPLTNLITPGINAIAYPLQAVVSAIDHLGPLAAIIANPLQNVVNVLNTLNQGFQGLQPSNALTIVGGLLGPVLEAPAALGAAAQHVIDAVRAGNLGKVVTAILSIPATVIGGVLNGGFGPDLSSVIKTGLDGVPLFAGGLLTVFGINIGGGPMGFTVNLPGPIAALQILQKLIAGALKPPSVTKTTTTTPTTTAAALPAASSLPAATAATIALPAAAVKTATADATKANTATTETGTTTKPPTTVPDSTTQPTKTGTTQSDSSSSSGKDADGSTTDSASTGSTKSSGSGSSSDTGDTKGHTKGGHDQDADGTSSSKPAKAHNAHGKGGGTSGQHAAHRGHGK